MGLEIVATRVLAPFLAAIQILVYCGGIVVLFLFVVLTFKDTAHLVMYGESLLKQVYRLRVITTMLHRISQIVEQTRKLVLVTHIPVQRQTFGIKPLGPGIVALTTRQVAQPVERRYNTRHAGGSPESRQAFLKIRTRCRIVVPQIGHESQVTQRIVKSDVVPKLSVDRRRLPTIKLRSFIVALIDRDVAQIVQRVRDCESIA